MDDLKTLFQDFEINCEDLNMLISRAMQQENTEEPYQKNDNLERTKKEEFVNTIDTDIDTEKDITDEYQFPSSVSVINDSAKLIASHNSGKKLRRRKKPFCCDVCEQCFYKKYQVKKHILQHHSLEEKMFNKCNICDKMLYLNRSSFLLHKQMHNSKKKCMLLCEICGKMYTSKSNLSTHKLTHSADKLYKCDFCNKTFVQKSSLKSHVRIHTGEKQHKCQFCDRAFVQKSSLQSHERTHTGEKPYSCDLCDKSFVQKAGLITHNRIHTRYRPYPCDLCDKKFSRPSSLLAHKRRHAEEKL